MQKVSKRVFQTLFFAISFFIFSGCTVEFELPKVEVPIAKEEILTRVRPILMPTRVVIDTCEYLETKGYQSYSLTHKGNCTNKIHEYRNPDLKYYSNGKEI
jgi:hypothetical protein